MAESFGARLRQQREERQIDLIAIAEQTKIKAALLDALERDDLSRWPSGIFRRAYVRSYAHSIGLDPDVVLREFLEAHPDQEDVLASLTSAATTDPSRNNDPPPTRLRAMVDSAIASLVKLRQPAPGATVPSTGAANPVKAAPRAPADPPAAAASIPAHTETEATSDRPASPAPERREPIRNVETPPSADQAPLLEAAERDATAIEAEPPAHEVRGLERPALGDAASAEAERATPVVASESREVAPIDESTLDAIAELCTRFGRVVDGRELLRWLQDAARLLTATGLIAWLWDESSGQLRPVLAHGYSARILSYLPLLKRDADNATAAAFRAAEPCEVAATAHTSGALVVPLLAAGDCIGVLAIELKPGIQPARSARTVATLVATLLAPLVHRPAVPDERTATDTAVPVLEQSRPPLRPTRLRR